MLDFRQKYMVMLALVVDFKSLDFLVKVALPQVMGPRSRFTREENKSLQGVVMTANNLVNN